MEITYRELQANVEDRKFALRQQYPLIYRWIDICMVSDYGDDTIEYGLNWSCVGTKSLEETNQFIKALQFASEQVEDLNDWLEDKEVVY